MTDTRTIFLSTDGRHVTLTADPTEQMDLIRQVPGTCGWFASMSGDYYRRGEVLLMQIMAVGDSIADRSDDRWDEAVAAFQAARKR